MNRKITILSIILILSSSAVLASEKSKNTKKGKQNNFIEKILNQYIVDDECHTWPDCEVETLNRNVDESSDSKQKKDSKLNPVRSDTF